MMTISWMMTTSDLAGDFLNYEEMLIESDNENLIIKQFFADNPSDCDDE